MAAVGYMERGRRQELTNSCGFTGPNEREHAKKNGFNRSYLRSDEAKDLLKHNKARVENVCKLNGSLRNGTFTKPSNLTLRSHGEADPLEPLSPRRKRRHSRPEKSNSEQMCVTEDTTSQCQLSPCQNLFSSKDVHTSPLEEKEISRLTETKCLKPISPGRCWSAEGGFGNPISPDNSRSCTPLSISTSVKDSCLSSTDSQVPEVKLQCKWKGCGCEMESSALMDHINHKHVDSQKGEKVVCLWQGCKVYDVKSSSKSWLRRHILSHSGDKPFRCIVDGCRLSFTSQKGLERHVNSHFNITQPTNQKPAKSREDTPTKLWKRRRVRRTRPCGVKPVDYMDSGVMEKLQQELTCIMERTNIDLNGSSNSVTFHSTIIARRTEKSGINKVLLHWRPENIIPDTWILESEASELLTCVIPVSKLPQDSVASLHPSLYRRHRFRKQQRK